MKETLINIDLLVLIAGFILIAAAGDRLAPLFQRIRLPLITGLLVIGIIAGPFVLDIIPMEAKDGLAFINDIALAFIAFAAGAELYLRELRNRINSIKWNTFGQLIVTFTISSIAVFYLAYLIPFMRELDFNSRVAISLLSGTIFVARSPASAIAVINELRAKGPFTQTVMGVTVLKDFLVILLFTITLSFSKTLINGEDFSFLSIVVILAELALSVGLGVPLGKLIATILKFVSRTKVKNIVIILVGYLVYVTSDLIRSYSTDSLGIEFRLEPLLICIVGSFYLTNYTGFRAEFVRFVEDSGKSVYTVFFLFIGATMQIDVLTGVWYVALIFFSVRLITMIIGSYIGGYLAKDPIKFRHVGWMPYITQAGVAIGLTTIAANEFPMWGAEFVTLIIAIIVINQFIGPPLFKFALHKVGEDRSRARGLKFDGHRDALIIGFENQTLTLARQLQEKGWEVQIATHMEEGSLDDITDVKIKHVQKISLDTLNELGAEKIEAIICMLSDDENYEICELAYQNFGTKDLIVRIEDHKNSEKFLALGARIVDPSMAMVNLLEHFVRSPQATSLILGLERGQDSRDLELLNPNLHGISLRDLRLPPDIIILSVKRGGQMIISHGYTRLRKHDLITMVGSNKSLDDMQLKFEM